MTITIGVIINFIVLVLTLAFGISYGVESMCCFRDKKERYESISTRFLIISIISMLMLLIPIFFMPKRWTQIKTPVSIEKIVSLQDNNLMYGKFAMRSGYINEDLYYQYMVDLGDGGFVSNKIPASTAKIYYDNDNPRVEWYREEKRLLYFLEVRTTHKIYVPEGSIIEDYNINLN